MIKPLTASEIAATLRKDLDLRGTQDVLTHVNLPEIGVVEGGPEAVVDALLAVTRTLVMPAFTPQTQITPEVGPPLNAIDYGTGGDLNARAAIFRPDLPAHPDMGSVAKSLRQHPKSLRSTHPILSFVAQGEYAREILSAQTVERPLGPVALMEARRGVVLLMGADQRDNVALHLAEQRAGRAGFVRWALTVTGVRQLPHIPGCRQGFNAVWNDLQQISTATQIGAARCEVLPLRPMLSYVEQVIRQYPAYMLCHRETCLHCNAHRARLRS